MKTYGGSGVIATPLFTSALDGMSGQLHFPAALIPKKKQLLAG
jgi:hypothetical protein